MSRQGTRVHFVVDETTLLKQGTNVYYVADETTQLIKARD